MFLELWFIFNKYMFNTIVLHIVWFYVEYSLLFYSIAKASLIEKK